MKWQAIYKGKKVGRPRTEKEKLRVEPYYSGLTWVEVPDEEEEEGKR